MHEILSSLFPTLRQQPSSFKICRFSLSTHLLALAEQSSLPTYLPLATKHLPSSFFRWPSTNRQCCLGWLVHGNWIAYSTSAVRKSLENSLRNGRLPFSVGRITTASSQSESQLYQINGDVSRQGIYSSLLTTYCHSFSESSKDKQSLSSIHTICKPTRFNFCPTQSGWQSYW